MQMDPLKMGAFERNSPMQIHIHLVSLLLLDLCSSTSFDPITK